MTRERAPLAGLGPVLATVALAALAGSCSDAGTTGGHAERLTLATTRLCPLVPARDPAAASFPPATPVRVFGTDLGWTYRAPDGSVPILFGDSWQRIDVCPIQTNDDSLGVLELPDAAWAGFTATGPIPDAQCPAVRFAVDATGTAFAPITLTRWDGVAVPMGPLNTPIGGFSDGEREWGVFIVGGGQACSAADAASGAACPAELSPQAADLRCGTIGGAARCLDPGSPRRDAGSQAYYVHVAERVGETHYISRAMFLTNRYLNLGVRTVRAFDPDDPARSDYAPGGGALLMWGRPGFDDVAGDGDLLPYFAYHPLPFTVQGDGRIDFAPRFLTGFAADGRPQYGEHQSAAAPLYASELEPVNQVSTSWIAPLGRWLMVYGGSTADFADPGYRSGRGQPVRGAMYARVARDPWGPWSEVQPILTDEQAAPDQVCGHRTPPGCLAPPDPPIRPACIEAADPAGGGYLYGANVIDQLTRSSAIAGAGAAADVFWTFSAWHPYGVVLVRTRVTLG